MSTARAHVLASCLVALSAVGCLRSDTSCGSDDDCVSDQVCQAGACVVFVTRDAARGEDAGDADAPDSSTPDASPDAPDAPDAPPDASDAPDPWTLLARGDLLYPLRSVLRADGGVVVAYADGDAGTIEFSARRPDGMLTTPMSFQSGLDSLATFTLLEGGDEALRLVLVEDDNDLSVFTQAEGGAWSSRVIVPRISTRVAFFTSALRHVDGRLVGGLVELGRERFEDATNGLRAVFFDERTFSDEGLTALEGRVMNNATPGAVTITRADGSSVVIWHTVHDAVEYAEVRSSGALMPMEVDRDNDIQTPEEHGLLLRAKLAPDGNIWIAYASGDFADSYLRVRVLEPGGGVTSPYADLDLGDSGMPQDLDLVVLNDRAHLVFHRAEEVLQSSRLVWASYEGNGWVERTLDPATRAARFVQAHADVGGAHVVYTAHDADDLNANELRYQWVEP